MDFFLLGGFILNQGANLPVGLSTKHMCMEKMPKQVFDAVASCHYFLASPMCLS